jgi:small GTP-binding protein
MKIWDTAGEDKYKNLTKKYYTGAQAVVLTYDITSKESFKKIEYWVDEIRENVEYVPMMFLVANKADCVEETEVEFNKAQKLAKKVDSKLYDTSAKENTGII